MYNAGLFMNIIIHLLLKLRDLYSFPDQILTSTNLEKKYTKIFLENMLYKRDYILIFFNFMLNLIDNIWKGCKKNDVFKWCFPTSPLSRQMNCGILNKNFISDVVKYMKNYLYRQNWSYHYFNNYYFLIREVWSLSTDGKWWIHSE